MGETQNTQYIKMTQTPIPKLVTSLAVPTVISMMVTNVYNMVDTFFVSQLGTSASGAVGITATLSLILLTCGLTFGHGAGSIISRALGSQQEARADKLASTAFFSAFGAGAIMAAIGLLCLPHILRLLGSTKTILPHAEAYGFYILLAAPFTVSSYVLNNIMRYEGKARLAMIGLTTGAVLNMILDPIFIFGFHMGVHGAGLSTAMSQIISFGILLFLYISGHTRCKISIHDYDIHEIPAILKNGLPTLARQGMNCFSSLLLNRCTAVFGDAALAAISIVNQICGFIMSIMIGIGQGYQPVAGFNFGAKRMDRLKSGFTFTFLLGETVMIALSILFFFGATTLVSAFRNDAAVISIGASMLRLQCISLIVQPYVTCANMMFQSIGKTTQATLLATTRNGLYMMPLLIVLSRSFGLFGILVCQPIADILSFATALPMVIRFFRQKEAVAK